MQTAARPVLQKACLLAGYVPIPPCLDYNYKGKAHLLSLDFRSILNPTNISGRAETLSPSMRRPVDVKAHFHFFLTVSLFPFSQAASVAILASALFCERYSLGASWVYLIQ